MLFMSFRYTFDSYFIVMLLLLFLHTGLVSTQYHIYCYDFRENLFHLIFFFSWNPHRSTKPRPTAKATRQGHDLKSRQRTVIGRRSANPNFDPHSPDSTWKIEKLIDRATYLSP